MRIAAPSLFDRLASLVAAVGLERSPEGGICLWAVEDRSEVFGSVRSLVQEGVAVVAIGPAGDVGAAVSALRAGALEYLEDIASDQAIAAALERVAARVRREGERGRSAPDSHSIGLHRAPGRLAAGETEGWLLSLVEPAAGGGREGVRNTDSGVFSYAWLAEQFRRETWRSRRSGQAFSLAWVRCDEREDPAAFAAAVETVAREVDVVAEIGEREWAILLPETDRLGATWFRRRLWRSLAGEMPPAIGGASATAAATFPDGSGRQDVRRTGHRLRPTLVGIASHPGDADGLDDVLAAARVDGEAWSRSGMERFRSLGFWATVEPLLRGEFRADADQGLAVLNEIWREAARDPGSRSLVYLGGNVLPTSGPTLAAGSRLYLLGGPPAEQSGGLVTVAADPSMRAHQIALLLGERKAYAFLRRADGEGTGAAFHTSDYAWVDHLVGALHDTYDLPA